MAAISFRPQCVQSIDKTIRKCIPVRSSKREAGHIAAVKTQNFGRLLALKVQVTLLQNLRNDIINCFPMETWINISPWMLMKFERIARNMEHSIPIDHNGYTEIYLPRWKRPQVPRLMLNEHCRSAWQLMWTYFSTYSDNMLKRKWVVSTVENNCDAAHVAVIYWYTWS